MFDQLNSVVKEAGALLKEGFYAVKKVHFKSSIDLVTEYDLKIELFLKEKLAELFPDFELIGEETTEKITHPNKAIYIDPIDGTTNFVHALPFCAISIGAWEGGAPLWGIVYNPILDELFWAKRGEGAYLNGQPLQVSATSSLEKSLLATGFPYTKVERGEDYEWVIECMKALLPLTRDIRRLGSAALDLCYVAKGSFDAFYEVNLKPWDVAAAILILQEAGGAVSTESGAPYTLDHRIIAASNKAVHQDFIRALPNFVK